MPRTSSSQRAFVRDSLTPRRAVVSGAAVLAVGLAAIVAMPRGADVLPGAAGAVAERQVVTADALTAPATTLVADRLPAVGVAVAGRATTSPYVAAAAARHPVLVEGVHGPAVTWLQRRLRVSPATGYFGPVTLAAVVAFQKAHHLSAHGYVGPRTWAALTARPAPAAATPAAKAKAAPRPKPKAAPRPKAKPTPTPRTVAAPVTHGRVCPAPGASYGDGFLSPRAGHLHQGMDLMGRRGMPILAIENGYVLRQGRQGNGALTITLQGSSGSKFFYGRMETNLVRAGQHVRRGQLIGLMGDTGSPGAVHLHFEFWKSGGESAAVDPAPLLHSLCG